MSGPESNPHPKGTRPEGPITEDVPSTHSVARNKELADTVVLGASAVKSPAGDETAFGRYRVTRLLGRGGMGSVYLGYDEQLDRQVAIKVPHPALLHSSEGREAFLTEARTLARLEHPRIIAVYDAGQTDGGRCYVVFRFVDGLPLSERMQQARLSPREASELLADVADALHYAHKLGFVHRDIKPANILIDSDGKAWVADFGLAVAESNQPGLAGDVSGTPVYMSPEQTSGDVHLLDGRTDIWALGVMLYELLTGRRPFAGTERNALFEEINRKEPRPPRMIDETVPEELERIVLRCLRKPISERYTTARDLARDLRSWGKHKRGIPLVMRVVASAALLLFGIVILIISLKGPAKLTEHAAGPTARTDVDVQSGTTSDLAMLIEEMRGLRRDFGDSNPTSMATSPDNAHSAATVGSGGNSPTSPGAGSVELPKLPPGAWAPIPLPAGFRELEAELRESRAAGDEDVEESLLLRATNALIDAGHFAIAEHLANRMVELAGNDPSDVPFAYGQLGLAQYRQGKYDEAIASYQRSVDVYQKLYDRMMSLPASEQVLKFRSHLARLFGITLMRMGNVHKAADDYQLAKIRYDEARELYQKHDRAEELATLLLNYGGLESNEGSYDNAITLLRQGLEIAQASGNKEEEAEFLVNLGNAFSRSGDNPTALKHYRQAYDRVTSESDYMLRSALLGNWITSLLEEGEHERARQLLLELQSIVRPGDTESQRILEFLPALDGQQGPE